MKQIESRNNPIIKRALKSINNPNSENLIVVEGYKLLGEALKSGAKPEMLFVTDEENVMTRLFNPNNDDFFQSKIETITYKVNKGLMRELSTVKNPSEIIAFLTPSPTPDLEEIIKSSKMLVVLDRLQDPGNIGTIMRTSEAMGVSAIVLLKGCCNPNNHKVIRAAMGSSFRLPTVSNIEVEYLFKLLNKYSYMTVCADMKGKNLKSFEFAEKTALFMGQEGQGLFDYIVENCHSIVSIPMLGQVESLNVATSTAICLYEWARNNDNGE